MSGALAIENIEVVYNHSVQALRGLSIEVPRRQHRRAARLQRGRQDDHAEGGVGVLPYENGRVASGRIRLLRRGHRGPRRHQLARAGWRTCARAGTSSAT
jgi:branched-chain amino acid transport system ATP-binding protein